MDVSNFHLVIICMHYIYIHIYDTSTSYSIYIYIHIYNHNHTHTHTHTYLLTNPIQREKERVLDGGKAHYLPRYYTFRPIY